MRDITTAMKNYLATKTPTLATLWTITAVDGGVLRGTDYSKTITFEGQSYSNGRGQQRTAIQLTSDLSEDNFDTKGFINTALPRNELVAGRWDYAALSIYQINPLDPTMGKIHLLSGRIGQIKIEDNTYTASITSRLSAFKAGRVALSSPECRATFGDSRCGINLATHTTTGSITGVDAFNGALSVSLSNPALLLTSGVLTFTSGLNNGAKVDIKAYSTGYMVLHFWPVNAPQIGDTVSAVRGCNKLYATCKDVFENTVNFRGEPDIPGSSAFYDIVSAKPNRVIVG